MWIDGMGPKVEWKKRKKSKLELMAERAAVLGSMKMPELRRLLDCPLKELKGWTRNQLIFEVLENEFLIDDQDQI